MICLHGEEALGTIELFDFDPLNSRAGIGVLISKENESKGYATKALRLLIDYCFETLLLKQVFCNISASNERSLKLFKKFGFEESGRKKSWNKTAPTEFEDEIFLQLIK